MTARSATVRTVTAIAALAALAVALISASLAQAADPGRWIQTGFSTVPFEYYQGVTSDPAGNHYFDGFFSGLYRTDPALTETARHAVQIPPDVATGEGYNHIGDLSWDAGEGGRVLLPLECYFPGIGNFCGTGSFGVADPATLQWRYYVKLDPAEIPKAMWVEASPDGQLLWTSAGNDLLAYSAADVAPANAAPSGPQIKPVRRLVGAVPPSGVTGATFYKGRLLLAGEDHGQFQVWSIDTATGERQLEIEMEIFGESEGLDVFEGLGGVLHWQIGQINSRGPPTYGSGHTALVHFLPANSAPDCSGVTASPSDLWPPNHKLAQVALGGATDPDGDAVTIAIDAVTQDEPVGGGTAHTPDGVLGALPGRLQLRAERLGAGDGRVYEIAFTVSDGNGGSCSGKTTVGVPLHSGSSASDSAPPAHDSLGA
jgi:hypothetical protein